MSAHTAAPTYRTRAAFLLGGAWTWHTWTHHEGNAHAAILTKRDELGATGCDFGNADHAEESRYNRATRG